MRFAQSLVVFVFFSIATAIALPGDLKRALQPPFPSSEEKGVNEDLIVRQNLPATEEINEDLLFRRDLPASKNTKINEDLLFRQIQ